MGFKESVKRILKMCGHALGGTVHERLDEIEEQLKDIAYSQSALLQSNVHLVESHGRIQNAVYLNADADPAKDLSAFLAPFQRSAGEILAMDYRAECVKEMRGRGYPWFIVLYLDRDAPSFFCNQERSLQSSWSRMFLFRDRELFLQAETWCASALPRTYFRPE